MKEQVIAETRLVGIPQVAEAIGVGTARHAHDQRGGAAGLIVRIGITPVAEHQVQAVDGVDVARMGAEDHARDHFFLEIGHLVGDGIVTHERFGGRKEVALRRCERGVVGQVHLVRRGDGLERIVRTALHGGHDLVAVHECRHQCGKLRGVENSIEHVSSVSRLTALRAPITQAPAGRLQAARPPP